MISGKSEETKTLVVVPDLLVVKWYYADKQEKIPPTISYTKDIGERDEYCL